MVASTPLPNTAETQCIPLLPSAVIFYLKFLKQAMFLSTSRSLHTLSPLPNMLFPVSFLFFKTRLKFYPRKSSQIALLYNLIELSIFPLQRLSPFVIHIYVGYFIDSSPPLQM